MSAWYGASSLALVIGAVCFLYWVLASNLARQEDRFSGDELSNVRMVLAHAASTRAAIQAPQHLDEGRELYVRLLGKDGQVLLETPGMQREVPAPPAHEWAPVLASIRSPAGARGGVRTGRGEYFETLTAPAQLGPASPVAYIQVATNRGDEDRLLALYRDRMALVIGLATLATIVAGYLIARAGTRPVLAIDAAAARIGSRTMHERIATVGLPAELAGLAQTFNTMLDRLEQSFKRVSQFSDDVAHELRSPINNMRGEIEVALAREREPEAYRQVLGSCLEECGRISRIIKSLLFLARDDDNGSSLQREPCDVGRELEAVREFYEPAAAEQGLALTVSVEPGLTASLDRTLFQQAVANLISNALAHTPPDGEIRIAARRRGASARLTVADTGSGIAPEHLPFVFDRLYRATLSRSGTEHAGLGLAVVRSIVQRHGGEARIESAVGRGTEVELTFPDRR